MRLSFLFISFCDVCDVICRGLENKVVNFGFAQYYWEFFAKIVSWEPSTSPAGITSSGLGSSRSFSDRKMDECRGLSFYLSRIYVMGN